MLREARKPTALFILLSLLIHAVTFVSMTLPPRRTPPEQTRIEVEYKEPEELTPLPVPESSQRARPEKLTHKQIVEQDKQLNDEKDEKTRYLSAFNQKVIQQTRAEQAGKFNNKATAGAKKAGDKRHEKNTKTAQKRAPAEQPREPGELPELKELTPKFALEPGDQGTKANTNGNPSQTDDYIKDVQNGVQTLLSTREFVYYSYYNRIKEALRQHWEPTVREKVKIIYRQGRSIASAKDRITQVMVTLDKNGELLKVEVLTQSGVQDLDNAAIEAFRDAAPFPNPPKGMIESDGTIKIRWDFVLEA